MTHFDMDCQLCYFVASLSMNCFESPVTLICLKCHLHELLCNKTIPEWMTSLPYLLRTYVHTGNSGLVCKIEVCEYFKSETWSFVPRI